MKWFNVKLIVHREVRDQLRDRRTLFTIAVLPLLLYPFLGMTFLQVAQFLKEHPSRIWMIGADELPEQPPLITPRREADSKDPYGQALFVPELCASAEQARLLTISLVDPGPAGGSSAKEIHQTAREALNAGRCDAVVYFPPNFQQQVRQFHSLWQDRHPGTEPTEEEIPGPQIFYNMAKDKSRIAHDRVAGVLGRWREAMVQQNLLRSKIPLSATKPFEVVFSDVSEEIGRRAAVWSKILPFVLFIWALTGAFYPAIDLCAGEKERGTLETLLSSPAQRSEIVCGKLLAIMIFSMATSILNLLSMGLTGTFIIRQIQSMGPVAPALHLGPPPLASFAWLLLALVPISALFSAVTLAVAVMARSTKEGQYYLMPLLLISMPLMMLPMLPAAELDLGSSLIPITGVMLLLRALMEGQYMQALYHTPPVVGMTALCCFLAIRWAIDQFNNESVLFRESEQWDPRLWLRQLVRDRGETPSFTEAIMCGVLLLLIRFFASFVMPAPDSWNSFAMTTLVVQIALIATPALLMAIMLTRSPRKTLLLRMPSWLSLSAAVLLAVAVHPMAMVLKEAVLTLYPIGEETLRQLAPLEAAISNAPSLWHLILLVALLPAICEELAFRGFILSGLRHMGHKWGAILLCSLLFGVTHGILQQSLTAFAVGMIVGYLAVQTGSILPAVLFHLMHNTLSVLLGQVSEKMIQNHPSLTWLFQRAGEGYIYNWPTVAVGGAATIALLLWLRRLPYQASVEEKLQEALDHQSAPAAAR